jgi:hypothetical protein
VPSPQIVRNREDGKSLRLKNSKPASVPIPTGRMDECKDFDVWEPPLRDTPQTSRGSPHVRAHDMDVINLAR